MATIYTRKKSKYFWCSFKNPQGIIIRKSTRVPAGEAFEEKAQLTANELELASWENWNPRKQKEELYTFDELLAKWIEETDRGPGDIYPIKNLMSFFGGAYMNDITGQEINNYIQYRRRSNISNGTIRRELGTFSSAINYAIVQWEWPLLNPVEKRRPKPGKHRLRFFTFCEYQRLLAAARDYPDVLDFIEIAVNTGLRKMELLALPISQVDLKNDVIYLNPEDQKNKQYSTVALNKTAKKALMRRISFVRMQHRSSDFLFPGKYEGHREDIKRAWASVCKAAGVQDATPHTCRHTFASWLAQSGKVPIHLIKEAMRHSSVTVTEKYAHLIPKNVETSVNVLDQHTMTHTGNITHLLGKENQKK